MSGVDGLSNELSSTLSNLEKEMNRSSRRIFTTMISMGVFALSIDVLRIPFFSHDILTSLGTGMLAAAVVFWAVDVSFTKRVKTYNLLRELYLFNFGLEEDTKRLDEYLEKQRQLARGINVLWKRLDAINESDSQRIEILQILLHLSEMYIDLLSQVENNTRRRHPEAQRAYNALAGTVSPELTQNMRVGIAKHEQLINSLQAGAQTTKELNSWIKEQIAAIHITEKNDS